MAKYPPPIFDTIEEYQAAAALLGMDYDQTDHTLMPGDDSSYTVFCCRCPDTMTKVYAPNADFEPGERGYYLLFTAAHQKRRKAVKAHILGPRKHITPG